MVSNNYYLFKLSNLYVSNLAWLSQAVYVLVSLTDWALVSVMALMWGGLLVAHVALLSHVCPQYVSFAMFSWSEVLQQAWLPKERNRLLLDFVLTSLVHLHK